MKTFLGTSNIQELHFLLFAQLFVAQSPAHLSASVALSLVLCKCAAALSCTADAQSLVLQTT